MATSYLLSPNTLLDKSAKTPLTESQLTSMGISWNSSDRESSKPCSLTASEVVTKRRERPTGFWERGADGGGERQGSDEGGGGEGG